MSSLQKLNLRFGVITLMIFLAAISRIIPHPHNFAPIGGMALFGAAYFTKHRWAFIIPIISMWISDLALNNVVYGRYFDGFVWFYAGSFFTYAAFALIVVFGVFTLKKVRTPNIIVSALGASVIFFIVSNFGVWFSGTMYPKDLGGLLTCFAAGIPFFGNTVFGDLVYSAILFGLFELSTRRFPQLRSQPVIKQ
ncbi:MAG: hypothetical protein LBH98_03900 [Chitinispirillales bacterium]|jgi:hypothetical protein|nr:hypothetical protein [Chitinispirillales bacterium]